MPSRLRTAAMARLGVILAFVLCWEIGARHYDDPDFLAPASDTFVALVGLVQTPDILRALAEMVWQLASAFALSLVVGLLIGVAVGLHRPSHKAFFPIILWAYAFPQVTVLPVLVLIFGIGAPIKIVFGFTHGVFPIMVNVISGAQSVDPSLLRAARSMGASRWQIYRRVVIPHLVPSLFTGMRLGMTATLLGVILAELYATIRGIGYFTSLFAESFQPDKLFALVLLIAATAIILNEVLRKAEHRAGRWRQW